MWGPSRTPTKYDDKRREQFMGRHGWLLLPFAMLTGLLVDLVVLGLVLGNGLDSHSMAMFEGIYLWTIRPGALVAVIVFAYTSTISDELKERISNEWGSGDGEVATPWLLRVELLSILAVPVGACLYAVFIMAPTTPWTDSLAANFGFYTPWGWFLGILMLFTAPTTLGVARFAEAFAFTGDRGSDDSTDVTGRFR